MLPGYIESTVLIVAIIVVAYLTWVNYALDISKRRELKNRPCHKELPLPNVEIKDRLLIESIVADYCKIIEKNESNVSRIKDELFNGIVRGAIAGLIVGNGIPGMVSGAITFGLIGGIVKSYNLAYVSKCTLLSNKHC
jgi:hypothetical protein